MEENTSVVPPLDEETPLTAEEQALLDRLNKRKQKAIAHNKATHATEIARIRLEARKLDKELKPLYLRRQELAKRHEALTGVSKIVFKSDEGKRLDAKLATLAAEAAKAEAEAQATAQSRAGNGRAQRQAAAPAR